MTDNQQWRNERGTLAAIVIALLLWASAFAGIRAGLLVVSTADGSKQAEADLDVPPVFDGLIAADGRLLMSTMDGKVLCFGGK